jgi:hypothetical protein
MFLSVLNAYVLTKIEKLLPADMCYHSWAQFQACGCYHNIPELEEDPKCPWRHSLGDQRAPGKHVYWRKERASIPGYCRVCVYKQEKNMLDKELIEIDKLARVEGETLHIKTWRNDYWNRKEKVEREQLEAEQQRILSQQDQGQEASSSQNQS